MKDGLPDFEKLRKSFDPPDLNKPVPVTKSDWNLLRGIPARTPEQIEEDDAYVPPPRHGHTDGRVSVNELPSETDNIFDNENHEAW